MTDRYPPAIVNLSTTTRMVGDAVVLGLDGIADLASAPRLQGALRRVIAQHPGRRIVVDLDGSLTLDDVALGLLLGAAATARSGGGELEVVATESKLRERLTATRFDLAVAVRDSIV